LAGISGILKKTEWANLFKLHWDGDLAGYYVCWHHRFVVRTA